ncbi:hypothetical protein AVEN_72688-1 [Araneus ventricosus]|uniref:Uncharacterized protein n=1 Tax=Araneus ventricosus TaxID=182803 RepID=A0A4Y2SGL2_ARAVE|nr:hypothetical protein AVEN_72688-1 [Araneus ventricosus]
MLRYLGCQTSWLRRPRAEFSATVMSKKKRPAPQVLRTTRRVTNMGSRFPAMLVLWLGRDFHRGKYEVTGSSQAWTHDLDDKFGDFGDEIWDLKGAGIFSISLLGEEIRLNVLDDSM